MGRLAAYRWSTSARARPANSTRALVAADRRTRPAFESALADAWPVADAAGGRAVAQTTTASGRYPTPCNERVGASARTLRAAATYV